MTNSATHRDEEPRNTLKNGNFSSGLLEWIAQGDVALATKEQNSTSAGVRIGPGPGAIRQRYAIAGLRIVRFAATLKPDPPAIGGSVRVECYDTNNHRVMDLHQELDTKKPAPDGGDTGLYFKTHAYTASIVVSIEKESTDPGYLDVNAALLNDYDADRKEQRPLCNLDQYMQPFWQGTTVRNETVLLLSEKGMPASGKLMFMPKRILAVQDYALGKTYDVGWDYVVQGNVLTRTPTSRMPFMRDTDFESGDLKWYILMGKHIVVSYTHDDSWQGPIAPYVGDQLPQTMAKLIQRKNLTVVATGDSITLGIGTSGYSEIPPYMPTWADLFVYRLRQLYDYNGIRLYNTALGGMTSDWGKETASDAVASLDPDLVLIAFGMNDFWWMPDVWFRRNIQGIIQQVRSRSPKAEFILIASLRFDPAYAKDPQYRTRMASYVPAMRSLVGKGVQLLDMDAISGALGEAKKPKDLTSDPMHPNDFLARWYAQSLVAMLDRSPLTPHFAAPRGVNPKKGLGIYPELLKFDPAQRLNLGWYYNWIDKPMKQVPRTVEFVPMVFGWYGDKDGKESKSISHLRATDAHFLLGYNEPDGNDQSKLTPTQALDAWPYLMQTGLPLGSPAAVHADKDWMKAFMAGAAERGYRVDFITIHWYYLTDPDSFLGYIDMVHKLYRKPVWITEFANVDWDLPSSNTKKFTPKDVADFLKVVLPRLNTLDYVERYAWFTAPDAPYGTSSLFHKDGSLTDVGRVYAAY